MFKLSQGQKITCYNIEDMVLALEVLEDEGFTWINGGEKPTEWLPWVKLSDHSFPDSINFHSVDDKGKLKICRGSYPSGVELAISLENLFLNFLAEDMTANPENVKPLDPALWDKINDLTAGIDADINAPLTDD